MNLSAFQEQLSRFPFDASLVLQQMAKQHGRIDPEQITELMSILGLSCDELLQQYLMPLAASMTTSPISHFAVGAIVEGYREEGQGPLYLGANFEITGQPLKMTVHAEQSAVSNAWHQGENRIRRLLVNETPCGHCRQFLNELHLVENMEFIVNRIGSSERRIYGIKDLLPDAFGPADLNQEEKLLSTRFTELPNPDASDELVTAATLAAGSSYAPYSGCRSGVALRLDNGDTIIGQYAENVAFNPGLTAIEAALVNLRLNGLSKPEGKIVDAVLVEQNVATSHRTTVEATLAGLGSELRYFAV